MTAPNIRRAQVDDAPALSKLAEMSKRHWGYDDAFVSATIEEIAVTEEQIRRDSCFVAEVDGIAIGFYLLEQASLERMFVSPEFIGQGVGRALMEHLQTHAREQGLTRIEIISDPNAADFYRRMGAIESGLFDSQFVPGRQLPVFALAISAA